MLLEGCLVTSQLSVSCIRTTELEYVLLNNELTCHWGFKAIGTSCTLFFVVFNISIHVVHFFQQSERHVTFFLYVTRSP